MNLTRYIRLNEKSQKTNVRLLVSGFGLQNIVPVDEVIKRISALPIKHISKIKVIKYDPNKNISFLIRHRRVGSQLGEYLLGFNSIVVYRFKNITECFHVLFHEIGHHVYFNHISSSTKKKWVTELYRAEQGVTRLGCRNACEDFAEAYALYVCQPSLLNATPQKQEFITKIFS